MWECTSCGAVVEEEHFERCWKCGGVRGEVAEEVAEENRRLEAEAERKRRQMLTCLRCGERMTYAGTPRFHEGKLWERWLLGALGVNELAFDLYACRNCGKVELYADGVGEELREDGLEA